MHGLPFVHEVDVLEAPGGGPDEHAATTPRLAWCRPGLHAVRSHRSSLIFTGFSSSSRLRSHHRLPRHISTTPTRADDYTQAKCYLQLNIVTTSI
jgi:hypothetical protein